MKSTIKKIKFTLFIGLLILTIFTFNKKGQAQPPLPPDYVATVTLGSSGPNASNILPGTQKIIYLVQLSVSGSNSVTLKSLTVNTAGSFAIDDIVAAPTADYGFQLYYNNTADLVGTPTLLKQIDRAASGSALNFADLNFAFSGAKYLIIVANISTAATSGNTIYVSSTSHNNFTFEESVNKEGPNPILASGIQTIRNGLGALISLQNPTTAASISANSSNNILYVIRIDGTNYLNAPNLTGLTVNTAGTYLESDFVAESFKLWYSTVSNLTNGFTSAGTGGGVISTSAVPADGGGTVNFLGLNTAVTTTCYLYVTANTAAGAINGNTINITSTPFTNFTFASSAVTLTGTNPVTPGATLTISSADYINITKQGPDAANLSSGTNNNIIYKLKFYNPSVYSCFYTASCGTATSGNLTVNTLSTPTFSITSLGSTTFCPGGYVDLVTNTGSGYNYQWQEAAAAGGPFNPVGSNTSTFRAQPILTTTYYRVIVTTPDCGSYTSANVTVTLRAAPNANIYAAAGGTTICSSQSRILYTTTGTTFLWKKDGVAAPGTNTASSYTATGANGSGNYTVDVTNICGTTISQAIPITVVALNNPMASLSVTSSTLDYVGPLNICSGTAVSFTANTRLTTPATTTYQWKVNGANSGVVTSSNTFSYTVTATVSPAVITCEVTNGCGTGVATLSNAITLTPTTAPANIKAFGPTTVCNGSSVVLRTYTPGATCTYQWQKDGTSITGATATTYTAVASGDYRVLVTTSAPVGCAGTGTSDNITVTMSSTSVGRIEPLGSLTTATVCTSNKISLNVSNIIGTPTYQWRNSTTVLGGEVSSVYTPTVTQTAINVLVTNTCNGYSLTSISENTSVTLSALTTAALAQAGSVTVCPGTDVLMYANNPGNGYSYQWRKDGVDIPGATNSTYTATTNNVKITGLTLTPSGTYNSADFSGTPVKLWYSTNGAHTNGNLSGATPLGAAQALPPVDPPTPITFSGFNQATGGTFYLYVTLDVPSSVTDGTNLKINATPLANVTLSAAIPKTGVNPILEGGLQTFLNSAYMDISRAAPTSGTTVNYATGSKEILLSSIKLTQTDPINDSYLTDYSFSTGGSYITADIEPASVKLYMNTAATAALPAPVITAIGPTTICIGSNVELQTNNVPGYIYQWQSASATGGPYNNITDANNYNYIAEPVATTYYKVVVTSPCGTATSAYSTVTVTLTPPNANITMLGANTICSSTATRAMSASVAGSSYVWKRNGTDVGAATTAISYTHPAAMAAGTYTYTVDVTNACGTMTSPPVNIVVQDLAAAQPLATIFVATTATPGITTVPAPTTVCSGKILYFTANQAVGVNPNLTTYQWKANGVNIGTAATVSRAFSASETITVDVINGCGTNPTPATASVPITVSTNIAPINVLGATTVCKGGGLYMNTLSPGTTSTYQWQKDGNNITNATLSAYTAYLQGDYRVIVNTTNPAVCGSGTSVTQTLSVENTNVAKIKPLGSLTTATICNGGAITLEAVNTTGSPSAGYQWRSGATAIGGATDETYTPTIAATTTYTLGVTNTCSGSILMSTVSNTVGQATVITVGNPTTTAPTLIGGSTLCHEGIYKMFVNPGNGYSYQWYKDGNIVNDATNSIITVGPLVVSSEAYSCQITSSCGAVSTSSTTTILSNKGTAIAPKDMVPSGGTLSWNGLNLQIPKNSTRYLNVYFDSKATAIHNHTIYSNSVPFNSVIFSTPVTKTNINPTLAGGTIVLQNQSTVDFATGVFNYTASKQANSDDVILFQLQLGVTIASGMSNPTLNSVKVITNGTYTTSDFKPGSIKLWYGSTSSNVVHHFNSYPQQLGSSIDMVSSGDTLKFTGLGPTGLNFPVPSPAKQYFYITGSLNNAATNGNNFSIRNSLFSYFPFNEDIAEAIYYATGNPPYNGAYPLNPGATISFLNTSYSWKSNATTTDWNFASNWNSDIVPINPAGAIIQTATNHPVINAGSYDVNFLVLKDNSSVTIEPNNAAINFSTNDLIIRYGASFIINAGTGENINVNVKNVIIEEGGTLTIANGANITFTITGDITNAGTITATTGKITFGGSTQQNISGTTTFHSINVNNAAGVVINDPCSFTGILTLQNGVLTTNNKLTLISNATQTGCISGSGAGTITGTVTVQRYNNGAEGYHYISTPTANTSFAQIIDDMAGNVVYPQEYETYTTGPISHLWEYDETNVSQTLHPTTGYTEDQQLMMNGWRSPDPTSAMVPMKGYSANIPSGAGLEVTETVNNGPYSLAVTYSSSGNDNIDGWNLMGNPYPSPIDWDAAAGWTKTNVNDAIYFFVPTSKYAGQHQTYIGGVGNPGTVTSIIPMFQAFWVKTTDNGILGVTNAVRVDNTDPTFYKKNNKSEEKQLLRLKGYSLANTNLTDGTVIYFSDGPTRGFDGNYDAYKLMNNDGSPNLYTIAEGSKLSINALPELGEDPEDVVLEFDVSNEGEYQLDATEFINFPATTEIYLEDKALSILQDLRVNSSYTFTIKPNDSKSRFVIHFKPEITDVEKVQNTEYLKAYTFGKNLVLSFNTSQSKAKADINIYNIFGQKVISDKTIGIGTHNIQLDLATGFYYVRMTYNNRTVAQKVFIE